MANTEEPKYLQLSQDIEARILSGSWASGRMPSLRELAEDHGVSVVTAARAVQELRVKGLISRADRSGCYLAPDSTGRRVETWGLCLRVTPGSWQRISGTVSRTGFEVVSRQGGVAFREIFDLTDGASTRSVREQIRKAGEQHVKGVFFLPSRISEADRETDEVFLEACDAEGLPVVLLDRNLRGRHRKLDRDLVGVDDLDGGIRCTEYLLAVGRRRPAIVVASPCSSHDSRVAGYLHALHAAASRTSGPTPEPIVLEQPTALTSKEADRWLADQLQQTRADGVVCYQDSVAIGLIMELLSRGVAVPRDMAVVGFDNLPIGDVFTLGVTTYSYPSEAIARHALRVMRQRLDWRAGPPIRVSVAGELIVRESTGGPAPR